MTIEAESIVHFRSMITRLLITQRDYGGWTKASIQVRSQINVNSLIGETCSKAG